MATDTKTKRKKVTFDGLQKGKYSKVKQEYLDQDYIHKLSNKDKAFLSKFMFEELGANLRNARFNKTKKDRKRVYDANNARQRDIWSVHKALGRISFYTSDTDAMEWWESKQEDVDVDELAILEKPEYEDAIVQMFYHIDNDEVFTVLFRDDGTYEFCSRKEKKIISRKEYVALIAQNVARLEEPT